MMKKAEDLTPAELTAEYTKIMVQREKRRAKLSEEAKAKRREYGVRYRRNRKAIVERFDRENGCIPEDIAKRIIDAREEPAPKTTKKSKK
jgi:tRNA uridine 5-carbamoylmethylation protein Kti12